MSTVSLTAENCHVQEAYGLELCEAEFKLSIDSAVFWGKGAKVCQAIIEFIPDADKGLLSCIALNASCIQLYLSSPTLMYKSAHPGLGTGQYSTYFLSCTGGVTNIR